MKDRFNKILINNILSKIPEHLNPVNYLADILDLSKESIYRRIRGEVLFTLEDIYVLSKKLPISFDEIIYSSEKGSLSSRPVLFGYRGNNISDPEEFFFKIFSVYEEGLENLNNIKTEVIIATNHLMIFSTIHLDYLFRFYYYKWVYHIHHMPLKFRLADIKIPGKITELRERIKSKRIFAGDTTYILDRNFLRNSLIELQYYYKRRLISCQELLCIQEDLFSFVDMVEGMVKENIKPFNFNNYIFIPIFRIESTGLYLRYGDREICQFWLYSVTNIVTTDGDICEVYRRWLVSLKKYSTLITGCNEALQTEFIDQQRKYVENITNKDFSYE
jgi:hypothetical protein